MAKRIIEQLVSDLSGKEIADGEGQTVKFGWLGAEYQIDLTESELEKFAKVIDPYVSAGTKLSRSSGSSRRASTSGSGRTSEELAAIRAWAKENGYEVSDRGRIKQDIVDAFEAS